MKTEVGYQLMSYDFKMGCWVRTEITAVLAPYQDQTNPSYVILKMMEGDNEGLEWNETIDYLNNSDHYRECAGLDPAPPGKWTDPAGGVHDDDEEDPAAMYE